MIFSNPQKVKRESEDFLFARTPSLEISGYEEKFITDFFTEKGLICNNNGEVIIKCSFDHSEKMTYIEQTRRLTDEKYVINTNVSVKGLTINIIASGKRAVRAAINTIYRQIESGSLFIGLIEDYPLFHMRGYIEGFYGSPWSFKQRMDMMKLMCEHGMNSYFYAPKDDPYHREKWFEPYPKNELKELKALIDFSEKCCMDFYFCIAPGLSLRYTSESDYSMLLEKVKQLYKCNVKGFGLLLDDIPSKLQYPEDIERFGGETVNAHIELANRFFDDLKSIDKSIKLVLCPLQYHGKGNEYFISKLGSSIEPQIDIFWTGRNICSQELTVPEAFRFIESTNHRPLYWDNFPVNDAEMFNEMHLGYITGRQKELFKYSQGLISNCMEYCESSKIPLLTVADYLWNPLQYNPEKSWDYAVKKVLGELSEDFKLFAENLLDSCLKVSNSPKMCGAMELASQKILSGDAQSGLEIFEEYLKKINITREILAQRDNKIFCELERWIKKFNVMCDTLNSCFDYLTTGDENAKSNAERGLKEYIEMPEVFANFCFQQTVEFIINNGGAIS